MYGVHFQYQQPDSIKILITLSNEKSICGTLRLNIYLFFFFFSSCNPVHFIQTVLANSRTIQHLIIYAHNRILFGPQSVILTANITASKFSILTMLPNRQIPILDLLEFRINDTVLMIANIIHSINVCSWKIDTNTHAFIIKYVSLKVSQLFAIIFTSRIFHCLRLFIGINDD